MGHNVRLAAALLCLGASGGAQPRAFKRHRLFAARSEVIRGAALEGRRLAAWGDRLLAWDLPDVEPEVLDGSRAAYGEGGCLIDVDGDRRLDLVLQEGGPLGTLVWLRASDWRRHVIDTGIQAHDIVPATLHGRRGVLLVQRGLQVRFYEVPAEPAARWPAREIYSFYTPSQQAGLRLADVNGDGLTDIFCGNYWIRGPARFELPWRLFAINTWSEELLSATVRLALADVSMDGVPDLVASQGELPEARLAWFEKPADPTQLWTERRFAEGLRLTRPHALAAADLDGDGRPDLVVGENNGARSRLVWLRNAGGGRFEANVIAAGTPVHTAFIADVNGDGRQDVVTAGPSAVDWWEN